MRKTAKGVVRTNIHPVLQREEEELSSQIMLLGISGERDEITLPSLHSEVSTDCTGSKLHQKRDQAVGRVNPLEHLDTCFGIVEGRNLAKWVPANVRVSLVFACTHVDLDTLDLDVLTRRQR
jgi:hypothetical protein